MQDMAGANSKPYDWRTPFLVALTEVPVLNHACRAVGVDHSTAWRARRDDPEFAALVDEAMEVGVDRAEQEAFRRAVGGFEEPVVYQGQLTYLYERDESGQVVHDTIQREDFDAEGKPVLRDVKVPRFKLDADGNPVVLTVRKHSDALLALILKGRRKKVYAERTELTGADGGPMVQQVDDTTRSARVAQLMALAEARKNAPADDADGLV